MGGVWICCWDAKIVLSILSLPSPSLPSSLSPSLFHPLTSILPSLPPFPFPTRAAKRPPLAEWGSGSFSPGKIFEVPIGRR
jgi:hypothetical protein